MAGPEDIPVFVVNARRRTSVRPAPVAAVTTPCEKPKEVHEKDDQGLSCRKKNYKTHHLLTKMLKLLLFRHEKKILGGRLINCESDTQKMCAEDDPRTLLQQRKEIDRGTRGQCKPTSAEGPRATLG